MNKNLEGSIYTNNYLESLAGGTATIIAGPIYKRYGTQMFKFAYLLAIIGGFSIYMCEREMMPIPPFYLNLFEGTKKVRYINAIDTLVPRFAFVSKLGIYLGMVCVYQASFTNDRIFKADQRSTCVGTCQLVARTLTCLSPEVNELASPMPILIFLGANVIAFGVSFTMPDN